jgi:putative nucleotidyltransferase with HDIG domain
VSAGAGVAGRLEAAESVAVARGAIEAERVWVVGGAVRDAALGEPVRHLDLAIAAGEEREAARALARAGGGFAFPLSAEHGTWRAVARDDAWHADVTALRAEAIEDDLRLRDFTVNAVAVPLAGGDPIDPLGGLGDAEKKLLRAASPDSFSSDPLRLLRASRLAARYGLALDDGTLELARAEASRAGEPAGERQFAELRGIVAGPDPLRGLTWMDTLGITAAVLPELEGLRGVVQNPNHHLDVHGHTLAVVERLLEVERDLPRFAGEVADAVREVLDEPLSDELTRGQALRFGALLHDIGKPQTRSEQGGYVTFIGHDKTGAEVIAEICRRLKTSAKLSSHLQGLALHHLRLGFMVHQRPLERGAIYDYLSATEPVAVDVTLLTAADRQAARGEGPIASEEMIEAHLELVREVLPDAVGWHRDPPRSPLNGDEIAAEVGLRPGPEMGEILERLRRASYAGEISGRDQAIALARELAAGR